MIEEDIFTSASATISLHDLIDSHDASDRVQRMGKPIFQDVSAVNLPHETILYQENVPEMSPLHISSNTSLPFSSPKLQ